MSPAERGTKEHVDGMDVGRDILEDGAGSRKAEILDF